MKNPQAASLVMVKVWMLYPCHQEQSKDVYSHHSCPSVPSGSTIASGNEKEITGIQIRKEELKLSICKCHTLVSK